MPKSTGLDPPNPKWGKRLFKHKGDIYEWWANAVKGGMLHQLCQQLKKKKGAKIIIRKAVKNPLIDIFVAQEDIPFVREEIERYQRGWVRRRLREIKSDH